jgi:hypothetical protein
MIASIKLLVATLGVSQFSDVVGTQGDFKEKREQLRRNLRSGTATTEAQTDEAKRKMQFIWEDDTVQEWEDDQGFFEGLDDIFAVPSSIEDAGDSADDDYFKNTDSGMAFDWDGAEGRGVVHEHTTDTYYSSGPTTTKVSKVGIDISSNSKMVKASKVGKMMWDESPVMLKGGKSMKGLKGLKSSKKDKSGKSVHYEGASYYDSEESRGDARDGLFGDAGDLGESGDGWLSSFQSTGKGYGGLFSSSRVEDNVARSDDYFDPSVTERADFEGDNEIKSRASYTFDDDFFQEDERLVFLPRPVVTLAGSVFSVNPQTVMPPVVPDGSGNTLTLGTEYLFNEVMTDAQNIDSQLVPIGVDAETVLFVIALDGYCDRIGPADQNSVQGYCFLTYTFIDPQTQMTAGSFTAQGIIVNADVPGQLTVSGGTGVMTGATGLVEILPASVDQAISPPLLIQPPAGSDPFNGVAGWAHFFEFDVDILFFLPELYGR